MAKVPKLKIVFDCIIFRIMIFPHHFFKCYLDMKDWINIQELSKVTMSLLVYLFLFRYSVVLILEPGCSVTGAQQTK